MNAKSPRGPSGIRQLGPALQPQAHIPNWNGKQKKCKKLCKVSELRSEIRVMAGDRAGQHEIDGWSCVLGTGSDSILYWLAKTEVATCVYTSYNKLVGFILTC